MKSACVGVGQQQLAVEQARGNPRCRLSLQTHKLMGMR